MIRTLLSVIAGYVITALCVMVLFSAWYLVLGTDGAYRPESYEVTVAWIAGSLVAGFIAAFVGGFATARIAANQTAPRILALVFVIVGLIGAFLWAPESLDLVRPGDVSFFDAASMSVEPRWMQFLNPFLGAVGVLLGAARARRPEDAHEGPVAGETA